MLLIAFVPHGEIVHDTREQTTFGNTKEETRTEISTIILDDT
jgi:hypothetical protein